MKKYTKLYTVSLSLLLPIFVIIVLLFYSQDFLLGILQTKDNSRLNYFALERFLKISSRDKLVDEILISLKNGQHKERAFNYLLLLGIIGEKKSVPEIMSLYAECNNRVNDNHCRTIQSYGVLSMGLIGDKRSVWFLEGILKNYDRGGTLVDRQSVAIALYLITGKQYVYFQHGGFTKKLELWDTLIRARKIIVNSENRKRTIKEMVDLYKSI